MEFIHIKGARQHNLKNINLSIPKNKLIVLTGLSGSGKSSLAFDTIYAEGQRRYVESLSSYARQFLGLMSKPDVDSIEGLSPAISIDQKTTSHNPRSTVGTITEIYDYLRLLYARVGHPHCPSCGKEISQQSIDQIVQSIIDAITLDIIQVIRLVVLAPVVRDKKGEFTGLLNNLSKKGISTVRIDNQYIDLDEDIFLIKTNKHTIDAVLDRISLDRKQLESEVDLSQLRSRLTQAVESALDLSSGQVIVSTIFDKSFDFPKHPREYADKLFSEKFACADCNLSLPEVEPRLFSFNSPQGACPTCTGLGTLLKLDQAKLIAPEISISEGAIIPLNKILTKDSWYKRLVEQVLTEYGSSIKTRYRDLNPEIIKMLFEGTGDRLYMVEGTNRFGRNTVIQEKFTGFIEYLNSRYEQTDSEFLRHELEKYMTKAICPSCNGQRLKPEALSVTIGNFNISELTLLPINQALEFINTLTSSVFSHKESTIAELIIKEIKSRLTFLTSVGLSYLSLSREASTLAGGEAQRIRLASQIGTGLTGVLYILDEPTIGLHPKDNDRLIDTLKHLRDLGNSVLVVEHDQETMRAADQIIDFGKGAGQHGGEVVAQGTPDEIVNHPTSLTAKYLSGRKKVKPKKFHAKISSRDNDSLKLTDCNLHNLKNIDVEIPLGRLVCITGVSGSGKSTLMHDTLYQALLHSQGRRTQLSQEHYARLENADLVKRVSLIDQSPIGRTPRSNPATYTKVFDLIRDIFANTKEAKSRGFKPGRFSFNVKGGRCEACQGEGQVKIEMQFLPDVYITCEVCQGTRYNFETLEAHYKGKNIGEILNLTVEEALEFFHNHRNIKEKIQTLSDVGLSYITLGQPAPTLSGGEAQRVKLAKELSIRSIGHTVYLLDEPTTGLHFEDVNKLLQVLYQLVELDNTVVVIEHNLDIIANSHYIIDLGPEGGDGGGQVIATGSPETIAKNPLSQTGLYLAKM